MLPDWQTVRQTCTLAQQTGSFGLKMSHLAAGTKCATNPRMQVFEVKTKVRLNFGGELWRWNKYCSMEGNSTHE